MYKVAITADLILGATLHSIRYGIFLKLDVEDLDQKWLVRAV